MRTSRDELAAAERQAWAAFLASIDRVPPERRDIREVVPGWSVKDLVWHNAGWALFSAEELTKLDGLPFTDPFAGHDDDYWDRENAAQLEAGRELPWDQMLAQTEVLREGAHQLWAELGELTPEAADWFAEETSVHYRGHGEEIERFLEG
jgi:Mycothiol maleylpyruvate isomerase N-terminal domain.